jgi:hypothetical protein
MVADPDSQPYPRRQNGRDKKKTGRIFLLFSVSSCVLKASQRAGKSLMEA